VNPEPFFGPPGVSEAKAFARQAVENVVVQSRALLEQRTGETKVLVFRF